VTDNDWRETLKDLTSGVTTLYKNVFVYTMLCLHQYLHDPAKYPRHLQPKKIKLIAHHERFKNEVFKKDFVKMPEKPPKRARYTKAGGKSITQLDEEFAPID